MTVRPGRNLLNACLGLLALTLAAVAWPPAYWLLPFGLAALIGLAVREWFVLRETFRGIAVRRSLPTPVGRGLPFSCRLEFDNALGHTASGEFRDVLPGVCNPPRWTEALSLKPNSAGQCREQAFRIPQRGQFTFGPVWVRLEGPWKFLDAQQSFAVTGTTAVLPEGLIADSQLARDTAHEIQHLDKLLSSRHRGVGTEFGGLAEYRPGDDPRRMDWRATARLRRPIVRQYQLERHRDVMIVVDCGRLMGAETPHGTKLDRAIDAALMLARVALRCGDRCGMAVFSDQVNGYLRPIAGLPALRAMTETLYDLQPNFRESDFGQMFATLQSRQTKRSLLIVISDIVDADTSQRFRDSLAALSRRHVVLFAALQTPLLAAIVAAPLETYLDATRKAVVFRNQREREHALYALRRGGVHVLDVTPQQLTVPLINQFIELRAANLL